MHSQHKVLQSLLALMLLLVLTLLLALVLIVFFLLPHFFLFLFYLLTLIRIISSITSTTIPGDILHPLLLTHHPLLLLTLTLTLTLLLLLLLLLLSSRGSLLSSSLLSHLNLHLLLKLLHLQGIHPARNRHLLRSRYLVRHTIHLSSSHAIRDHLLSSLLHPSWTSWTSSLTHHHLPSTNRTTIGSDHLSHLSHHLLRSQLLLLLLPTSTSTTSPLLSSHLVLQELLNHHALGVRPALDLESLQFLWRDVLRASKLLGKGGQSLGIEGGRQVVDLLEHTRVHAQGCQLLLAYLHSSVWHTGVGPGNTNTDLAWHAGLAARSGDAGLALLCGLLLLELLSHLLLLLLLLLAHRDLLLHDGYLLRVEIGHVDHARLTWLADHTLAQWSHVLLLLHISQLSRVLRSDISSSRSHHVRLLLLLTSSHQLLLGKPLL